jgi:predicted Fe-Mo cluster-binding NifX family protein
MSVSNKIDYQFFAEKMMLQDMKIVVPTKDGKQISTFFRSSPYYKILNIKDGRVKHLEVISNTSELKVSEGVNGRSCPVCRSMNIAECFCDCQVVIIRRIDHKSWDELGHMGIEVIQTDENDVDQSVEKYLDGTLQDKYNIQ